MNLTRKAECVQNAKWQRTDTAGEAELLMLKPAIKLLGAAQTR
jgi:hypothetical protein